MITSAEEFVRLRCSEDPQEYHRAAHEAADESIWLEVIANYPDMRKWVAHNKTVPINILDILSTDPNWRIRDMVATKRKIPESLQLRLANDVDSSVRGTVAGNAKATTNVLELLSKDPDEYVRERARKRLLERTST